MAGVLGSDGLGGPGLRPAGRQDRDVPRLGVSPIEFVPKVRRSRRWSRLEPARDKIVEAVANAAARPGKIGDGKVVGGGRWSRLTRVRTGEFGDDAV